MSDWLPESEIQTLFLGERILVDVRAEIEFLLGHIPNSINLPILNTEERELIGTCYKEKGQNAAVQLGHQLISGSVKQARLDAWSKVLSANDNAVITCFRGGMRSKITQSWCAEIGLYRPRVRGGTKKLRQILIDQLITQIQTQSFINVTGPTGSGKTELIRKVKNRRPTLDLELAANHRGSAFGSQESGQNSQITFENQLSCDLLRLKKIKFQNPSQPILIEDESRMIGKLVVPEALFLKYRDSSAVLCEDSLSDRTLRTFDEYILNSPINSQNEELAKKHFEKLRQNTLAISKKLGGLRTSEVLNDLLVSEESFFQRQDLEPNKLWIEKLLKWYYDPIYQRNLDKRAPHFIFRGSFDEVHEFLQSPS